jgi:ABC-type transport system involved in multi-copper enzyme maturation permease subunit
MLVIPRYDALEIFARRAWVAFYVASLLPPLVLGAWVYIAANSDILGRLIPGLQNFKLPLPGPDSWASFTYLQLWFIVVFALLVGPPLATRDFANNALPLYLSKALRRFEYILGRWAFLLVLLSAASWLPLLVVFGLEMALAPSAWRSENAWIAIGILASTLPVVVLLTALISAVAAHVHRANLARGAVLAIIIVTWPLGRMLESRTNSPNAQIVSPMAMAVRVNIWAFEPPVEAARPGAPSVFPGAREPRTMVSVPLAFAVLLSWLAACIGVLLWRVRPVEVIK